MDADTPSTGALQAADDQLGKLASSLLESLNKGGAESTEAPLDQIYHYFREKTWKKSTSEALLQTWSACALLLSEDLNPEVSIRPTKEGYWDNGRLDQRSKISRHRIQG